MENKITENYKALVKNDLKELDKLVSLLEIKMTKIRESVNEMVSVVSNKKEKSK